jgi:hypothetical protein
VPVHALAGDGDKQLARLEQARVDGKARGLALGQRVIQVVARAAQLRDLTQLHSLPQDLKFQL